MATRHTRQAASLAVKSTELALAVPQVMAHRLTRMALAGSPVSERDRKEFQLMLSEKNLAFAQAWIEMSMQAMRANQALATSMFTAFFNPFSTRKRSAASVASQVHNAAMGVFAKGLAPVHRKATANAKRLAKTKLR